MTPTEAQMVRQMAVLTDAVLQLVQQQGARLTRAQLAQRLGVHRNTLTSRLASDATMPRPDSDGKWLLSEVVAWELRRQQ